MGMQMTLTDPYRQMADSGLVITGADAGMGGMLRMRATDAVACVRGGCQGKAQASRALSPKVWAAELREHTFGSTG